MRETLWIALPEQEAAGIKRVIDYIANKNLAALSVEQLLNKLINNEADEWRQAIAQYNNIPSVGNIEVAEMHIRTLALNNQFFGHQAVLVNKVFSPNELLGLIVLCYSNPLLIGPKLCRALNENDSEGVAKEILENSAFVTIAGRVVPRESNLRLLNYALYANNTAVQLPMGVLSRIRTGAMKKDISLVELGRLADTNHSSLAAMIPLAATPLAVDATDAAIRFQRLQQGELESSGYLGMLAPVEETSFSFNTANNLRISKLLTATLFLLHIPVVSPVIRNMGRDIAKGLSRVSHYTGSFFSRNLDKLNTNTEEQVALLSHGEAKP
ncbi:MAG: hypothetical protein RLZZ225_713 [Pseudomonadota bacterium]|jgi:hypothetical protein